MVCARIENNLVTQVISADTAFIQATNQQGTWVEVDSYEPAQGYYPGIGYRYDTTNQVFDLPTDPVNETNVTLSDGSGRTVDITWTKNPTTLRWDLTETEI